MTGLIGFVALLIFRFCGTADQAKLQKLDLEESTDYLLIEFESDEEYPGKGFTMGIEAVKDDKDGKCPPITLIAPVDDSSYDYSYDYSYDSYY